MPLAILRQMPLAILRQMPLVLNPLLPSLKTQLMVPPPNLLDLQIEDWE